MRSPFRPAVVAAGGSAGRRRGTITAAPGLVAGLVAAGVLAAGASPASAAGGPAIPTVPASAATGGGGPASGGPGTANCPNRGVTSNFHEHLASEAELPLQQLPASAVSVPTWSGSFTTGGTTYPFTMAGSDPAAGQVTHVPVEIIPLRLDFAGNGCVL